MARILIDLTDAQLEALAAIVAGSHKPRAAVIREAIEAYLVQRKQAAEVDVFGLWKSKRRDGLAWQQELRSEW